MGNCADKTRYDRAVQRVTAEAFWLFTEQTALRALNSVTSHGLDFFRVAFTGLLGDRLLRLVRVFEQDLQVASFWYLVRCNRKAVEEAVTQASGSMEQLQEFSARLKLIRDKTFVHIDKQAVFDPAQIYEEAGISNSDVDKTIRVLWGTMPTLYRLTFGKTFEHDVYSGDDVVALERLRDSSSASQ